MDTETFVARINELRYEHSHDVDKPMSILDFAKKADISPQTLSQYINGQRTKPNIEILLKIANTYTVSVDWLLGRYTFRNTPEPDVVKQVVTNKDEQMLIDALKCFGTREGLIASNLQNITSCGTRLNLPDVFFSFVSLLNNMSRATTLLIESQTVLNQARSKTLDDSALDELRKSEDGLSKTRRQLTTLARIQKMSDKALSTYFYQLGRKVTENGVTAISNQDEQATIQALFEALFGGRFKGRVVKDYSHTDEKE